MLPGSTLFDERMASRSAMPMPRLSILPISGTMRSIFCGTPVMSAMATCGSCSMRRFTTFSASVHISRKASPSVSR